MVILGITSGTVPGTVREAVVRASCRAILAGVLRASFSVVSTGIWMEIRHSMVAASLTEV
ncbi:hypothetical protein JXD38_06790 [candidate division WOR-3 bacterium]|nr:hypothetical protein [candidate division WOR-3 bacterium]